MEEGKLSFLEKLGSWKRWGWIAGSVLPILGQALTGELGWPIAAGLAIATLITGIFGLAKEDAARLEATAKVLAAQIAAGTKK